MAGEHHFVSSSSLRACIATAVADEHDLLTVEAGSGDRRQDLHRLRVPRGPTIDRREALQQPVTLAELADELRPRAAAQQDGDAGRGDLYDYRRSDARNGWY